MEVAKLVNGTDDREQQSDSGVHHATAEGTPSTVANSAHESAVNVLAGDEVAAGQGLGRDDEVVKAVSEEAVEQYSLPGRSAILAEEGGMIAAASGGEETPALGAISGSSFDPRLPSTTTEKPTAGRVLELDGAVSADEGVPIPSSPLAEAPGDMTRVDQGSAGDPESAADSTSVSGADAGTVVHDSDDTVGVHTAAGADAEAEGSIMAQANDAREAHQPCENLPTAELRVVVEAESAPTEEEGLGGAVVSPVTFSPMIHHKQAQVTINTAQSQRLVCITGVAVGVGKRGVSLGVTSERHGYSDGCQM